MEKYGYIYLTRDTIHEKYYIGKHKSSKFNPSYKGSGKILKDTIKKYGKTPFQVYLLEWCFSLDELNKAEVYWINYFNAVEDKSFYNIALGGDGGVIYKEHPRGMLGKPQTEHQRQTQSEFMLNNNPFKGKSWDDYGGHPKGMLGKQHSDITKNQISDTLRKKNVNCKRVEVIYPNNTIKTFNSITEAAKYYNIHQSTLSTLIKKNEPYKYIEHHNRNKEIWERLDGVFFKIKQDDKTDNTEITEEIKDSLAS